MLSYKFWQTFIYCPSLRYLTLNENIIATKSRRYDELEDSQKCRRGLEGRSSMSNQVVWVWNFLFLTLSRLCCLDLFLTSLFHRNNLMKKLNYQDQKKILLEVNYFILIAGSSPSSSSSSSVNPMASLGALQTLAGATAGLNVSSLAGK